MGVHRSTYCRWKRLVERQGLEMLRPRDRALLEPATSRCLDLERRWRGETPVHEVLKPPLGGGGRLAGLD